MAYLDTARLARRPKLWISSTVLLKQAAHRPDGEMPSALSLEIRRHLHQAQEMVLVGLLAAGAILAIAGAMLIRL
jgi:hypothetical protein